MITPRPLWLLSPGLKIIRNGLPRALTGQPYKLERPALFCSGKCPKAALHALTQHYVAGALAASSPLTVSNQPRRGIAIRLPASAVTSALSTDVPWTVTKSCDVEPSIALSANVATPSTRNDNGTTRSAAASTAAATRRPPKTGPQPGDVGTFTTASAPPRDDGAVDRRRRGASLTPTDDDNEPTTTTSSTGESTTLRHVGLAKDAARLAHRGGGRLPTEKT